ncbi:hypothetical protein P7K49_030794 [Saguinus oedipus]|uniref:Rho-GAP domain-containing protein n=1 Tax=Saguinus oedipus TaxID=9490 RepID=A0ABQ9U438_SAGOE|nr:hypothetical protein P7K49_030794 [Saguinus oedipus]
MKGLMGMTHTLGREEAQRRTRGTLGSQIRAKRVLGAECSVHGARGWKGKMEQDGEDLECLTDIPELFPSELENPAERVHQIQQILVTLPRVVIVVMRYLFAFLNHLSQYSDENMMDPYNLAICFGPTLMHIPDGQDPVSCQAHINEVIKTIIIHHEAIFPSPRELEGPLPCLSWLPVTLTTCINGDFCMQKDGVAFVSVILPPGMCHLSYKTREVLFLLGCGPSQ